MVDCSNCRGFIRALAWKVFPITIKPYDRLLPALQ